MSEQNSEHSKPIALDCALGAQELAGEVAKLRELERQYSQQLGRMAQLCDTVCPWVLNCPPELVPVEVAVAAADIMEYVNAVRP